MGGDKVSPKQNTTDASIDGQSVKNKQETDSAKKSNTAFMQKIKTIPKKKLGLFVGIGVAVLVVIVAAILIINGNKKSYEQYDLKGLTIKDACEKARGAGWKVDGVYAIEGDDKTDCYNTSITVTDYDYYEYNHSATIYFGKKKTEEEKKAECEASGKWYRDGNCKSEEEWENDYAWKNAHAACKKYGASAYAKTLTDCYLGSEYQGPVDGQPAESSSSSAPTSSSSTSTESSSSSSSTWRQILSDYETWMNKYIDFMIKYKNTTDTTALTSMLSEYSTLVSEMSEWSKKLDDAQDDLSVSDLNEYIQTLNRINQRLSEVQ